ncbi:MAG: hypothetical protein GY727_00785 [Gammaproteobacteria bacterium]|nr:hypothetical protein [Gammaproteobacteria bacterium]MCP4089981.1 hypothetical protein [Gammaproteobacteria bacterium]MCP4276312.1 hypothetical protein [Gammaproteobacteria bacterium]MCP4831307.1 hypothetical protein [Gammaproteobacteria bacterium]MCP4928790.1 hypothetical protein [Gammaproteobacteria bacterium]
MLNQLLGMPALFFILLVPLCMAATAVFRSEVIAIDMRKPLLWLAFAVLFIAILGHLYFAFTYLFSPSFIDHIEPNTAIVAWLYANGDQIYHPLDSAERYSFLYGPLVYVATGLLYKVFVATTLTAKLAGVSCLVLTMVILLIVIRRRFPEHWYPCVVALGYFSLLALFLKHHSFWLKPDPFIIVLASVGLLACLTDNKRSAWLMLGVALGCAVNAKITGAIYFFPFLAWIYERDGFRPVFFSGLTALLVAALPFLLSETISLPNYIAWLQAARSHGLSKYLLVQNTVFILFACIPVFIFLFWQRGVKTTAGWLTEHKLVVAASLVALLLIIVAASKQGSGPNHFLPFLPALALLTASASVIVYSSNEPGGRAAYYFWAPLGAMLIVASVKAGFALYYGVLVTNGQISAERLTEEINEVAAGYPDRNLYMGYGDGTSHTTTFVRNNLAYAGYPYLIDSSALMDFQLSGIEMPQSTIDSMVKDGSAVWLIPEGQEPFTLLNWYYRPYNHFLFNDEFRSAFNEIFKKVSSTKHYDIYVGNGEVSNH